jgi:hypothetical protein
MVTTGRSTQQNRGELRKIYDIGKRHICGDPVVHVINGKDNEERGIAAAV